LLPRAPGPACTAEVSIERLSSFCVRYQVPFDANTRTAPMHEDHDATPSAKHYPSTCAG
jgi:hypothetical protein